MNHFAYAPRILTMVLAMAACELPTKLGNLTATDSTGEDSGTTADTSATDGETSEGTTDATTGQTTVTSQTSTTQVDPSETTSSMTTAQSSVGPTPIDCLEFSEADCEVNGCMAYYGSAYEFPGCSSGPQFLGCTELRACEHDKHTFCREGTDEAYEVLATTCSPPGFIECEPPGLAFCDSCGTLNEAECLAEPSECQPIYGAPHIETNGSVCADYTDMRFLICQANGGACPPFIPVVCDPDDPDQAYDSPSGCIPAGWVECGEMGTSGCD